MPPIYITGAGVVSAIGVGKDETLSALMAGQTGIRQMKYLSSCHDDLPVGEVQLSNDEMMAMLSNGYDIQLTRTALKEHQAIQEDKEEDS